MSTSFVYHPCGLLQHHIRFLLFIHDEARSQNHADEGSIIQVPVREESPPEHFIRSTYSSVLMVTSARPEKPSSRAAAGERSIILPRTNGPRSLMMTSTDCQASVACRRRRAVHTGSAADPLSVCKLPVVVRRFAGGSVERLKEFATELVRLKVRVIVAVGAVGTEAARGATTSIPICFANAGDPVGHVVVALSFRLWIKSRWELFFERS